MNGTPVLRLRRLGLRSLLGWSLAMITKTARRRTPFVLAVIVWAAALASARWDAVSRLDNLYLDWNLRALATHLPVDSDIVLLVMAALPAMAINLDLHKLHNVGKNSNRSSSLRNRKKSRLAKLSRPFWWVRHHK